MASAKTRSKHSKDLNARYKASNKFAANKKKKLERHLKKYPNDAQAAKVLKAGKFDWKRCTPKAKVWTQELKQFAAQLRQAGLSGNYIQVYHFAKANAQPESRNLERSMAEILSAKWRGVA